ncbi:amidase domain-containing protein [Agromyces sp. Leaf222]|uniref:amidase domain-containing protein n=1 Tax=Agromyces sp. Leaf222 TaxID=1735688 RepID=UPI000AB0B7DC|nr:amidase domain-containing protein [Agromyces sp. Leaf222]
MSHPETPPGPSAESQPAELAGAEEMTDADRRRMFRRRRTLAVAAVVTVLAVGCGFVAIGWASATQGAPAPTDTARDSVEVQEAAAADDASAAPDSGLELDWASLSPGVSAQMEYVQQHWDSTSSDEFGFLDENDCMAFTSQSLLARGWVEDDEWWYAVGDPYSSSPAWRSSTAFMEYLEARPELATMLTDDQRDQVKVGDVVQFDWDDSGDRDHTGIVTAVVANDDGTIDILYAGHTDATWDRSVDYSITEMHPGGVATYWSIAG